MEKKALKEFCQNLSRQVQRERLTWIPNWKDAAKFVCPVRPRFNREETNKGGRRNRYIINGAATRASRTTVAGLSAGLTPSNRSWFLYTHANKDLAEKDEIKSFLYTLKAASQRVLSKSNFYQAMNSFYYDWVTFSNACLLAEPDDEDVVRYTTIPVGEWGIANDKKGRPRIFVREFWMTVRQVVTKFCKKMPDGKYDFSNVSGGVRSQYENGNQDDKVYVTHLIFENDGYNEKEIGFKKKFYSVYYEEGTLSKSPYGDYGAAGENYLSLGGYDLCPVFVGRWGLRSGDSYGSWGPTDVAIGDIRELQYFAKLQAEAVEAQVHPSVVGSSRLQKEGKKKRPKTGEMLHLSDPRSADSYRRMYDFNHDISHTTQQIDQIMRAIDESYYVNAFKRFISSNRQYMTAKQVMEEEKEVLTELSPVLEMLNKDVLNPLIDHLFMEMDKRDMLPDVPEELQGELLDVEYVSALHQAQKLMNAASIERFTGFIGNAAGVAPGVLYKIDENELVDAYGEVTSVPPGIVKSNEAADAAREEQAAQQQQMQQLDNAAVESDIAKNLGSAKINEEENALGAILGGGVRRASAGF